MLTHQNHLHEFPLTLNIYKITAFLLESITLTNVPVQHLMYWFLLLLLMIQLYAFKIQFSSVAQSCLTLCNPMNRNTPGPPVHLKLS